MNEQHLTTLKEMREYRHHLKFAAPGDGYDHLDDQVQALDAAIKAFELLEAERQFICRKCHLRSEEGVKIEPTF